MNKGLVKTGQGQSRGRLEQGRDKDRGKEKLPLKDTARIGEGMSDKFVRA